MAITITIQAASDATMTTNGEPGGTLLADSDLRKVYGLPNQFIDYDNKLNFVKSPRWDTVKQPQTVTGQKYTGGVLQPEEVDKSSMMQSEENDDLTNTFQGIHRPPTTTAFQLRCTSISHDATDQTTVSPMPGVVNAAGIRQDSGTPGQLNNLVMALGMRTEVIKLEGVLVDEGPISASNPRKQVLMNIARLQYFKTGRSGNIGSWGGPAGGPLNPRSYPCLTIFDSELNSIYDDSYQITQPSGTNLSYRGLIKSFSFRQEGGRPNQWFWTLEFQVLQNEHNQGTHFMGQGVLEGVLRINRIRLINQETGAEISSFVGLSAGDACIEVRTSDVLQAPFYLKDGTLSAMYGYTVIDPQPIFITNSNSTPKINGDWEMYELDYAAKTFRLRNISSPSMSIHDYQTDESGYGQPLSTRAWTAFTNGNEGYVSATFQNRDGSMSVEQSREASRLQHEVMYLASYNEQKAQEELWAENE
jgi:hypothetical protein